jgi:hypothetical protein
MKDKVKTLLGIVVCTIRTHLYKRKTNRSFLE